MSKRILIVLILTLFTTACGLEAEEIHEVIEVNPDLSGTLSESRTYNRLLIGGIGVGVVSVVGLVIGGLSIAGGFWYSRRRQ